MPPLEAPFINTPDPSDPPAPPDPTLPLMPTAVATTTPPVFPTLPPLLPLSVISSTSSPRNLTWMSSASPSSNVSWATPGGTDQPGFPRFGAFPAWRMDGHELAWAEVSTQTRICRFSLLLNALRETPCPFSQSFLPIPAIAASLWDAVVAPNSARMAYLRVGSASASASQGTVISLLDGAETVLHYDPARLRVESITPGARFPLTLLQAYDNTAGRVRFASGTLGQPVSSEFSLFTVRFRALASGLSSIGAGDDPALFTLDGFTVQRGMIPLGVNVVP